jgi:hypothetical protein
MDWEQKKTNGKIFWHLTLNKNLESIKSKGLLQSKTGQQGKGLYAIEANYELLEGVVDLLLQEKSTNESIYVVQFNYQGTYYIHQISNHIMASEGWVLIPNDIKAEEITKIIPISEMEESYNE